MAEYCNDFLDDDNERALLLPEEFVPERPIRRLPPRRPRRPRWSRLLLALLLLGAAILLLSRCLAREEDEPFVYEPPQPIALLEEQDIVIVLDAGHGGNDRGASFGAAVEKEMNLQFTLAVGALLSEAGYEVLYTREEDTYVGLEDRADFANRSRAHIFVSIHCNSSEITSAQGVEVYYNGEEGAEALAGFIHEALVESTGARGRGCLFGRYVVLSQTLMPGVLVETGFLSNEEERSDMLDAGYAEKIAEAIAGGIEDYIAENK